MSSAPIETREGKQHEAESPRAAERYEPAEGDVLDGSYRLQEPIGAGGVGTVFRALQLRVHREVAVKFLQHEAIGEDSMRPRFEHEALALAELSHPNIVRLQDYGITSGLQYLVMELVDGRTLRDVLEADAPMPPQRALALVRQLAHALAYAHARGVVHRDLKPMNVLVRELPARSEHVTVLDFGFAKFLPGSPLEAGAPVTSAGIAFGSPAYISPEQCAGGPIDGRADLYAVGVLLYEMLTGLTPFDGDTPQLIRHHLMTPVPKLLALRPELGARAEGLQALLERLMAKRRDERVADAAELIAELDALEAQAARASGVGSDEPATLVGSRASPGVHGLAALRAQLEALRELALAAHEAWRQWLAPALRRGARRARAALQRLRERR